MAGIDGEGRDDRIERAVKKLFEKTLLLPAHFFGPKQMNSLFG